MNAAEQTAAGLAAAIAGLKFAETGARMHYVRTCNEAARDKATVAEAEAAYEQWQRIRQAREALEWEAAQVPDAPVVDRGTGVTP